VTNSVTMSATMPGRNGGTLRRGNPGNAGGTGQPPSAIREKLRGSFEKRVKVLETIADDKTADACDRIRAVDTMAKYGLGALQDVPADEVRDRVSATIDAIRGTVTPEVAELIFTKLRGIWK
jgi:hypothetical protein